MSFGRTTPILRIFDEAKAREFYVDFLGFQVDWEHRFEPGLPLYICSSPNGMALTRCATHNLRRATACLAARSMDGMRTVVTFRSAAYLTAAASDGGRDRSVLPPPVERHD